MSPPRERGARAAAAPAAVTAGLRLPDFFIAGHAKSGTTALYEILREHPRIYMPASKEPWYFAQELLERTPPRPGGTPQTLQEYSSWFDGAAPGQLAGEATALYLWSRTAPARIAAACPDARIVAIFREPASFLRSLHLQFVQSYVETESDLRRALELEGARRRGERVPKHTYWPKALLYSEHVRYVEQLRRYREHFPAERMLVLLYDDFRADNRETVRRVLAFLGVEDEVTLTVKDANPTVRPRSQRLNELVHAVSVGHGPVSRLAKSGLKSAVPQVIRRRALQTVQQRLVYADPGPADAELMRELRVRFRGEVEALSEYLERDLVRLWGYDELD